jgi:hypothetical protein
LEKGRVAESSTLTDPDSEQEKEHVDEDQEMEI